MGGLVASGGVAYEERRASICPPHGCGVPPDLGLAQAVLVTSLPLTSRQAGGRRWYAHRLGAGW